MKQKTLMKWLLCGLMSVFMCGLVFADADPIVLNKTYTRDTEQPDQGVLTLEAFVTGTTTTITKTVNVPMDIIIVMDYSGSMSDTLGSDQTKFQAMWSAITEFLDRVYEKRDTGESNTHRVAFTAYASNYNGRKELRHKSAQFFPVADASGNKNAALFTTEVNSAKGKTVRDGTDMSVGVQAANEIFAANTNVDPVSGETRQRVVIFLTDGLPAGRNGDSWTSTEYDEADNTIEKLYATKNTYNAKVYTIGLFADAAKLTSEPNVKFTKKSGSKTETKAWYDGIGQTCKDTKLQNVFLHVASSDYPNATAFTKAGAYNTTHNYASGYYIPATSTSELSNIFSQLSESISSTSASYELASTTVLRDVMSDSFDLTVPLGEDGKPIYSALEAKVYKVPCTAITPKDGTPDLYTWGTAVELTEDDGVTVNAHEVVDSDNVTHVKIDISGFDYAANFVGLPADTTGGRGLGSKILITFPIHDNESGVGAEVPTNTAESGVYTAEEIEKLDDPENDEPVVGPGTFPIPEVDIKYCTVSYWTWDIDGNLVELPKDSKAYRGTTGNEDTVTVPAASITNYSFNHAESNGSNVALNNIPTALAGTSVKMVYDPIAYVHHVKTDGEESVENVLIYKALDENKKFDITTAVTGIYTGVSADYIYGGMWTDKDKTDLVTSECGKSLDPVVGKDYYVREVPDIYMQPKVLGKRLKDVWYVSLVAVIDDPDKYLAAGFGTVDSDMCADDFGTKYVYDKIAFRYKKTATGNPTVVTIEPNAVLTKKADTAADTKEVDTELSGSLICCELEDLTAYTTDALGYTPFYVTKDNVRVTGIYSRAVKTSESAAPTWTDSDDGSSTSVYTVRERANSITPLKSFLMGEEQEEVTVTAYVNGDATEYTIESGSDATEYVEIPEVDDMTFAGWYEEASCINPADLSSVDEDTAIYAKLLEGEYLNVQCSQVDTNKLVVVTAVDSASVASFGFTYTINGQSYTKSVAEAVDSYNDQTASQLFDVADGAKLAVVTIDLGDITEATIKIVPYWVTKNGIKVNGTRKSLTFVSGSVAQ